MRKSSIVRKTIRKTSKPRQKEVAKKVMKRLDKNRGSSVRGHATIHLKSKTNKSKSIPDRKSAPTLSRTPQSYNKIIELPVYEPTNEEFKQPLLLIRKLCKLGYDKYGCVKVKTPKSWKPEFALNNPEKKITTRKQSLRDLVKGKSFEQNVNGYTLEEFEEFANEFKENYKYKVPLKFDNKFRANEFEFWALIEDTQFMKSKVTVEYAADLPTRRYGSAFPTVYKGKATDDLNPKDEKTHPFNLNNINRAKDSLFQIITTKTDNISGITSPWIYFGMLFASFCWHVEDLYMYSINYMHKGDPKTWYCIPPEYKEEFDLVIREKYADLFVRKPDVLYNIVLAMNPLELVERNIPVYRTEQGPSEFIITFPKAYHAGFSHGFNISEAVNIATADWISYAKMAIQDYARDGFYKKGSFPLEWIVLESVKRVKDLDLTKEVKEQLLKEYELIVQKELQDREFLKACYGKVVVKQFADNLNRHDANLCAACKNYCYLSYATCLVCNKMVCSHHVTICGCVNATVILNIRFTEEELEKFMQNIKSTLPKRRSR